MIPLFHIQNYTVDTALLGNHLHGPVVREFEEKFAAYVGAQYAVSFNSATSAIFLSLLDHYRTTITIPSIIPPVVANAVVNAGCHLDLCDDISWVGRDYTLHEFPREDYKIIDSAHRVDKNQFAEYNNNDLVIFSFYPTKVIGSCDGGMIVSNDKYKIDYLRSMSMNGMSIAENNWDRKIERCGHKMYMNSIQAHIALQNLNRIQDKKDDLCYVRMEYNKAFGLNNTSDHLYRIHVENNKKFLHYMAVMGITCGIHYDAVHHSQLYGVYRAGYEKSDQEAITTASIPFHEKLSQSDITKIIDHVNIYRESNSFL